MSLIVLRNDDTQAPNSFQNSFTNTFEVEPNSEIALHSIALNRAPKYDISDRFFYVYHGEQLDESAKPEDLQRVLTPCKPSKIILRDAHYTSAELVTEVQTALRNCDKHPNYQQNWTAEAVISGDNNDIFQGVKIVCDQVGAIGIDAHGNVNTRTIPTDPLILGLGNSRLEGYSYTKATGEAKRTDDDPALETHIRTQHPMNLNRGEVIINFSGLYDFTDEDEGVDERNKVGIGRSHHTTFNTDPNTFYDIYMHVATSDDDEHEFGAMTFYQTLPDSDGKGYYAHEIDYYNSQFVGGPDPDSAFKALDEPLNLKTPQAPHSSKTYNSVRYVFENEKISIFVGDETATPPVWELVAKTSVKPISFGNQACFPKVFLGYDSSFKFIHQNEVTNYVEPVRNLDLDFDKNCVIDSDIDANALANSRSLWDATETKGVTKPAGEKQRLDYMVAVISGHVDGSEFYQAPGANLNLLLGYKNLEEKLTLDDGKTDLKATFTPSNLETPTFNAVAGDMITYVRCPTLTQKSLNGDTKSVSSIICDIPRYNTTQSYGRLYYSPSQKTYLKLHNKEKININRLTIELVNSNERLVNDLMGYTNVILHIRQSS